MFVENGSQLFETKKKRWMFCCFWISHEFEGEIRRNSALGVVCVCMCVDFKHVFTADHYVLVVDIAGSATEWIDVQRPTEFCSETNVLFWCTSIAMSCSVPVHVLCVRHHQTMESYDSLKQSLASFFAYTYSNRSDVVFYVWIENNILDCTRATAVTTVVASNANKCDKHRKWN